MLNKNLPMKKKPENIHSWELGQLKIKKWTDYENSCRLLTINRNIVILKFVSVTIKFKKKLQFTQKFWLMSQNLSKIIKIWIIRTKKIVTHRLVINRPENLLLYTHNWDYIDKRNLIWIIVFNTCSAFELRTSQF